MAGLTRLAPLVEELDARQQRRGKPRLYAEYRVLDFLEHNLVPANVDSNGAPRNDAGKIDIARTSSRTSE